MPVFHTKTIESILEPVSKQVGQLVILHEEGQDGNAIPNLDAPVSTVQSAVANLYKVGTETVEDSSDLLLKRDMPPALETVQAASDSLGQAAEYIRADPYSVQGREVLIKGARGILQGTSDLLLAFDQGEVRKLVKQVRAVLDYIGLADQIQRHVFQRQEKYKKRFSKMAVAFLIIMMSSIVKNSRKNGRCCCFCKVAHSGHYSSRSRCPRKGRGAHFSSSSRFTSRITGTGDQCHAAAGFFLETVRKLSRGWKSTGSWSEATFSGKKELISTLYDVILALLFDVRRRFAVDFYYSHRVLKHQCESAKRGSIIMRKVKVYCEWF